MRGFERRERFMQAACRGQQRSPFGNYIINEDDFFGWRGRTFDAEGIIMEAHGRALQVTPLQTCAPP